MRTLLFVILASFSFPAFAQSSLGISGLELSLGVVEDEAGDRRGDGRAAVNVAITEFHGFQGDLAFADAADGWIGTAAAHLFMTPVDGQKYGLFAALSDVDGRSMLYGSIGVEGIVSVGQNTSIEGRAGMGWADVEGLDYIFASAALAHDFTPAVTLEASLEIADFEEASFDASAYDFGLKATYSPEGSPLGAHISVTQSSLSGHDDATRVGLGLTITLGTSGGTDPHTRLFRTPDPVAPLVRRGLW
ncbi:MAG: hypothetical protein AAF222_07320 [Pseudomonadota bacterium]